MAILDMTRVVSSLKKIICPRIVCFILINTVCHIRAVKFFYGDYFILSQILERANPPSDIKNHVFDEREVMLYRPKYDVVTGNFKGLYKTMRDIIVRGDSGEFF